MKILKLLNKEILSIFIIISLAFINNLKAEDEPVDIWDLEKELEENSSNDIIETMDSAEPEILLNTIQKAHMYNYFYSPKI